MNSQAPELSFAESPRDQIKGMLGETLGCLLPQRLAALRTNPRRDQATLLDRLLFQGLVRSSTRKRDLEMLSKIHRCGWSEGSLVAFYEQTSHRFDDWFMQRHVAVIDELDRVWSEGRDELHTIVEIGCGAGQVLRHLADRFPQASRLVGLDVCAEQIEKNLHQNHSEKIEYHAGNALDWIMENAQPGTVFVSNGGVLEYFSPSELDQLLGRVQSLDGSLMVTIEPVAADHDIEEYAESQPFGNERSFSHNYPHRVKKAGLNILFQEDVPTDEYRFLLLLAESHSR